MDLATGRSLFSVIGILAGGQKNSHPCWVGNPSLDNFRDKFDRFYDSWGYYNTMGVLRLNPNLFVPIEFFDTDGSHHTARDWDELAAKIIGYRERRRLPPGNPQQEIVDQACSRWSDRCIDASPRNLRQLGPELNRRILSWIGNIVAFIHKIGFVDKVEAARRAAICAACPRQASWQDSCASCRSQINRVAKELLDGHPFTDQMKALNGCDALGEDTRVSIWLSQEPVNVAGLPEHCWRK